MGRDNTINNPSIIVISYGDYLERIMRILNFDNVRVACLIMVDSSLSREFIVTYKNKQFRGMSYEYLPECLSMYSPDYVLVLGEEDVVINHLLILGIDSSQILNLKILRRPEYTGFSKLFIQAEQQKYGYSAVVVGISYAMMGVDLNEIPFPTINLAGTSQDVFFNLLMMKKIISLSNNRDTLRYAIIGIAPYSFHFDMSKSFESWNIFAYYSIFHDTHNYHVSQQMMEYIFNRNYTKLYEHLRVKPHISIDLNDPFGFKANNNHSMDINAKLYSRANANAWYQKRYPLTVHENIKLFKEMLSVCHANSIIPIVVGFPFSPAWNTFFDSRLFNEFYETINNIQKQIPFYFLDYFNLNELLESDFYNVDHVNLNGARKVTRKITAFIEKIEKKESFF